MDTKNTAPKPALGFLTVAGRSRPRPVRRLSAAEPGGPPPGVLLHGPDQAQSSPANPLRADAGVVLVWRADRRNAPGAGQDGAAGRLHRLSAALAVRELVSTPVALVLPPETADQGHLRTFRVGRNTLAVAADVGGRLAADRRPAGRTERVVRPSRAVRADPGSHQGGPTGREMTISSLVRAAEAGGFRHRPMRSGRACPPRRAARPSARRLPRGYTPCGWTRRRRGPFRFRSRPRKSGCRAFLSRGGGRTSRSADARLWPRSTPLKASAGRRRRPAARKYPHQAPGRRDQTAGPPALPPPALAGIAAGRAVAGHALCAVPLPIRGRGLPLSPPRRGAGRREWAWAKPCRPSPPSASCSAAAKCKTCLLVCPKSLVTNWQRELNRWAPEIPVLVIEGDQARRLWQWRLPGRAAAAGQLRVALPRPRRAGRRQGRSGRAFRAPLRPRRARRSAADQERRRHDQRGRPLDLPPPQLGPDRHPRGKQRRRPGRHLRVSRPPASFRPR